MRALQTLIGQHLGRSLGWAVPAVTAMAFMSASASAAEIVLVVGDDADNGFNDPTPATPVGGNDGETLGEQRRIAFRYAASILGSRVQSSVPIRIEATFDDSLACGRTAATLASASPATFVANFASQRTPSTRCRWPTRYAAVGLPTPSTTWRHASIRASTATPIAWAGRAGTTASTGPRPTISRAS